MNKLVNQGFIDQQQLSESRRLVKCNLGRIKNLKTLIEEKILDKNIADSLNSVLDSMIKNNESQLELSRFIEHRMNKLSNQAYIDETQLSENIWMSRSTLYETKYLKTLIEHDVLDKEIAESLNLILDDVTKYNESQIELSLFIGHSNRITGY